MKSTYANRRKLLDTLLPDNDLIFRVVDKEADVDHYIKCQVKKSPEISEDQEVYKKFQFVLYSAMESRIKGRQSADLCSQ